VGFRVRSDPQYASVQGVKIMGFKKQFNIGDRKITTFVTRDSNKTSETTREKAFNFIEETRGPIKEIGLSNVWNSDQIGFEKEMHSKTTLEFKGVKLVHGQDQSMNAISHTYTAQPLISADGILADKIMLVLQEVNGVFGERVEAALPKDATNVVVFASKSGKCTKQHVRLFHETVLMECVNQENFMFIVDSWSGHLDTSLIDSAAEKWNRTVDYRLLPRRHH
jgi:hypothetical protein